MNEMVASTPSLAPPVNPWFIAITVTLATFMELLDTSIANVSLPHIAGGLATSYDESTWVLTSYLVANAVVLPLSAWLSRVIGRKRYYMICVALFGVSSLLCGLAPSLAVLIVCRVLQGIGGGGLAPVEQAILVDTFPGANRASALALYSMAIVTAPAIGPILGGWITDSVSWRWVFFINVPIGLLSLVLTSRLVSDSPAFTAEVAQLRQSGKLRIDYVGILLIAIGFSCLEIVLDRGQREDWFESRLITIVLTTAVAALTSAWIWEMRHEDPVVEVGLLKNRNFALACGFYFLFGIVLFGSTVLIPQMLQSLYGYTATDAGLVLAPGAFVIVLMTPLVVRLTRHIPAAWLIAFGFFVLGLALFYYVSFSLAATYRHEASARMLQGFGLAFLFVPISQLAYSYLPANKNNKASSDERRPLLPDLLARAVALKPRVETVDVGLRQRRRLAERLYFDEVSVVEVDVELVVVVEDVEAGFPVILPHAIRLGARHRRGPERAGGLHGRRAESLRDLLLRHPQAQGSDAVTGHGRQDARAATARAHDEHEQGRGERRNGPHRRWRVVIPNSSHDPSCRLTRRIQRHCLPGPHVGWRSSGVSRFASGGCFHSQCARLQTGSFL